MSPDGLVGYALNAAQEAYYGLHNDRLVMVNYNDLAQFPRETLADIHGKLELPTFEYTFDRISSIPGADIFDQAIGTPGLHSLKNRVIYEPRTSILPLDIFNDLPKPFWVKHE